MFSIIDTNLYVSFDHTIDKKEKRIKAINEKILFVIGVIFISACILGLNIYEVLSNRDIKKFITTILFLILIIILMIPLVGYEVFTKYKYYEIIKHDFHENQIDTKETKKILDQINSELKDLTYSNITNDIVETIVDNNISDYTLFQQGLIKMINNREITIKDLFNPKCIFNNKLIREFEFGKREIKNTKIIRFKKEMLMFKIVVDYIYID